MLLLSLVKWDTNVTIRRQISSSIFTINIFSELQDECDSMHKNELTLYDSYDDRGNGQRTPLVKYMLCYTTRPIYLVGP